MTVLARMLACGCLAILPLAARAQDPGQATDGRTMSETAPQLPGTFNNPDGSTGSSPTSSDGQVNAGNSLYGTHDLNSVMNPYGRPGDHSPESIMNPYGPSGSTFSPQSPDNPLDNGNGTSPNPTGSEPLSSSDGGGD